MLPPTDNKSQNESVILHLAFTDVFEVIELTKYLSYAPTEVITKLISRTSNSTCSNLIEVILKGKTVDLE